MILSCMIGFNDARIMYQTSNLMQHQQRASRRGDPRPLLLPRRRGRSTGCSAFSLLVVLVIIGIALLCDVAVGCLTQVDVPPVVAHGGHQRRVLFLEDLRRQRNTVSNISWKRQTKLEMDVTPLART